jgi:hypothetical protein
MKLKSTRVIWIERWRSLCGRAALGLLLGLASASVACAQNWNGWSLVPDRETVWGTFLPLPFITDAGFSVATDDQNYLILAAQRSGDHTIWLNSTSDIQLKKWDGWRQVPGGATTQYPPSVTYYYNYSTSYLVVTAVGIHGAGDQGVYTIFYNRNTGVWGNWNEIPFGATTHAGPATVDSYDGRLRVFIKWDGTGSGVYETSYIPNYVFGWSPWKQVPGNFGTNAQVCSVMTWSGGEPFVTLLASQLSTGHAHINLKLINYVGAPENWDGWAAFPYRAVTDAAMAGPLPNYHDDSGYKGFAKGIGDHRIYGLRTNGYEQIPGGKTTNAGLSSTEMQVSDTPHIGYDTIVTRNILFAKDEGLQKVEFNYFDSTSAVSTIH